MRVIQISIAAVFASLQSLSVTLPLSSPTESPRSHLYRIERSLVLTTPDQKSITFPLTAHTNPAFVPQHLAGRVAPAEETIKLTHWQALAYSGPSEAIAIDQEGSV